MLGAGSGSLVGVADDIAEDTLGPGTSVPVEADQMPSILLLGHEVELPGAACLAGREPNNTLVGVAAGVDGCI